MTSCIEQTIAGVNSQIDRIRELAARFPDQELYTSLTLFNHEISPTWDRIRPDKIRRIRFRDYRPDGMTALLDAIGVTLKNLQQTVGEEVSRDQASVVVVIITDGYENSSVRFTHEQISSQIRDLEQSGKWVFSYIGATLDAVSIAVSLNISARNAMPYDTGQTGVMFDKLAGCMDNYIGAKRNGRTKRIFLEEDQGN